MCRNNKAIGIKAEVKMGILGSFGNKKSGLIADVIRCDLDEYLVWKWSPDKIDGKTRENSIRFGSKLRVKDGEVAVFVYPQKDGTFQDFIEGPYDETLKPANFPILSSIMGAAFGGTSPFQAEVYFINLSNIMQVKIGVPFFDVCDPRYPDLPVPVAVRGKITFKITDYKAFIKLHRLITFDMNSFERQIRDAVNKYVKGVVTNIPADNEIPVIQLERKIFQVNEIVQMYLKPRLEDDFGITFRGLDISALEIDKDSDAFKELKAVTADITSQTVKAQSAINIKNLEDTQRINAENLSETLRLQREQAAYAQKLQTEGSNFQVHQLNQQAAVAMAGANALGQMGANGGASMGGGGGFNPAGMMAGMAMGGAVGSNVAGMMNNMMSGVSQAHQMPPQMPPQMPAVKFFLGMNGQPSGPYDMESLKQMVSNGTLQKTSLVWKEGMAQWAEAGTVQDLAGLFASESVPPAMPPM